ncbi:hypothetical protein [uncultured Jatrophihabitans sp.]|uniref:hypothetical protein n=1 Tax=uncultured Jatrophihabitans sp. TaxID=1610747 RepID=UPI0035CC302A
MAKIATIICLILAVPVVLLTAVQALRDRPLTKREVVAAVLLEVGVVLYVGTRVGQLIGGHRPHSLVLTLAYLLGILVVMPVAAALGIAERSKWGPVTLGVGALVVCVLFPRIDQVWSVHG